MDEEPVGRIVSFAGSERRSERSPDDQALIVAESYDLGGTVAVSRYPRLHHSTCLMPPDTKQVTWAQEEFTSSYQW